MLIKAYSQEIPCATEVSREYAEEMKKSLPEFELFKESFQKIEIHFIASSFIRSPLWFVNDLSHACNNILNFQIW